MDSIYRRPEDVAPKFQPIFEQLHKEFPAPYEIWNRAVDFGRTIIAAVLNPSTGVAVTKVLQQGSCERTTPLSPSEIRTIREHLASGVQDLALRTEDRPSGCEAVARHDEG
jgi:hypothetical protein